MLREIQEIQGLATKYSKSDLGRMVQMGLIDPQKAMMAGMMIDRIQKQNAQPPQTTVAEDLLGMAPQPPQGMPPGAPQGVPQGVPQGAPQMTPPQTAPQQPPQASPGMAEGGVTNLDAGDVGNYAGGGIVAFDEGGDVGKKYKYGKFEAMAREAAAKYGVDPDKFARLIETESHYKPGATSYAGKDAGLGIAQISKHHGLTEAQRLDPKFALDYAAKYFSGLLDKADGNYRKALERYKGVKTDKGRQRMAKHIAQVLGEPYEAPTRMASAPAVMKQKRRNPKIDVIDNPFAAREEDMGIPYQPTEMADLSGVNQLAMLSAPYAIQRGDDSGEYDMSEDVTGGFAGGGIVALAGGGVPRYAGEGPSQVTSSAVPAPNLSVTSYNPANPTYAGMAWEQLKPYNPQSKLAGSMGEFFSNMLPSTTQGTLRLDPKTGEPITLGEFMRRAEAERTGAARPATPAGAQGTQPAFTNAPKQDNVTFLDATKKQGADEADAEVTSGTQTAGAKKKANLFADFEDRVKRFTPEVADYEMQKVPERKEITAQRRAAYAEEGVDEDFYNKLIERIEEKKGDAASEKDRAAGEAIMMAGLKLMGARRGQEFEALSEGAQSGLKAYRSALDKLSERQEGYDARIEALRAADQQARRTGADTDLARRDAAEKAAREDQRALFQAKNRMAEVGAQVATSLSTAELNYMANLASTAAQREYANALREQQLDDNQIKLIMETAQKIHKDMLATNPNASFDDAFAQATKMYKVVGGAFGRQLNLPTPAAPTKEDYQKQYNLAPTTPGKP